MRVLLFLSSLLCFALPLHAQDYVAPRGPDGVHPDLNGIWQALGSAHYDIEMHSASHSMQLREGPHGPSSSAVKFHIRRPGWQRNSKTKLTG